MESPAKAVPRYSVLSDSIREIKECQTRFDTFGTNSNNNNENVNYLKETKQNNVDDITLIKDPLSFLRSAWQHLVHSKCPLFTRELETSLRIIILYNSSSNYSYICLNISRKSQYDLIKTSCSTSLFFSIIAGCKTFIKDNVA